MTSRARCRAALLPLIANCARGAAIPARATEANRGDATPAHHSLRPASPWTARCCCGVPPCSRSHVDRIRRAGQNCRRIETTRPMRSAPSAGSRRERTTSRLRAGLVQSRAHLERDDSARAFPRALQSRRGFGGDRVCITDLIWQSGAPCRGHANTAMPDVLSTPSAAPPCLLTGWRRGGPTANVPLPLTAGLREKCTYGDSCPRCV